ncbi:MAG: AAA family ATPase [Gemmatimonadales bacterium]
MDAAPRVDLLPVRPAADIEAEPQHSGWLIEGLWTRQGVGLIGGAPKCCKTWLALDLAVSVASGTPALGRFSVRDPGPVLFYGAEDQAVHLRLRIEAIAAARGLGLIGLELGLILCPSLRLDAEHDRARLAATLAHHRPRLLILDPLVRLHRIDENSANEMAALLAELRILQRRYQLALVLVHHLRKQSGPADGQALRGSGDLHAWGDSNLFLRRRHQQLALTAEHRTAPAPPPYVLELAGETTPHLRVVDPESDLPEPTGQLADRILAALAHAAGPLSRDALRHTLGIRNATLGEVLARLRAERRIERQDGGFVLDR